MPPFRMRSIDSVVFVRRRSVASNLIYAMLDRSLRLPLKYEEYGQVSAMVFNYGTSQLKVFFTPKFITVLIRMLSDVRLVRRPGPS
jgi:hypothetical protein